jgi:hypothetical protein
MQSVGKRGCVLQDISNAVAREPKKQKNNFYTETKGVVVTVLKMKTGSEKAKKAVAARISKQGVKGAALVPQSSIVEDVLYETKVVDSTMGKAMAAKRRVALEFHFVHLMGSPPEDVWLRDGVVLSLMKALRISEGSSDSVKKVLRDILAAQQAKEAYDPKAGVKKRGRKRLIVDLTPQALVVYKSLEQGLSTTQTTVIVNTWRRTQNPSLPALSWSAVERFILRSDVAHRSRRHTKKSGKDDVGGLWARARLAQCIQFKEQLRLGWEAAEDPPKCHREHRCRSFTSLRARHCLVG